MAPKSAAIHGTEQTLDLAGKGDAILLQFRVAAIENWQVEKAILLLHRAGSPASGKLLRALDLGLVQGLWRETASPVPTWLDREPAQQTNRPDGWISIAVPAKMVQDLVTRKASGLALSASMDSPAEPLPALRFHSRETVQYSPYLVVKGVVRGAKASQP